MVRRIRRNASAASRAGDSRRPNGIRHHFWQLHQQRFHYWYARLLARPTDPGLGVPRRTVDGAHDAGVAPRLDRRGADRSRPDQVRNLG